MSRTRQGGIGMVLSLVVLGWTSPSSVNAQTAATVDVPEIPFDSDTQFLNWRVQKLTLHPESASKPAGR